MNIIKLASFILFITGVCCINFESCEFASTNKERIKWLEETLSFTHKILFKYNMINWIAQGTLLGAVRNKTIFTWTSDADIQTYSKYIPVICNKSSKIYNEFYKNNYRIFDCVSTIKNTINFVRICKANFTLKPPKYISDGNPVESRIDIYGMTRFNKTHYTAPFSPCYWNLKWLYPLNNYYINNQTYKAPHKINKWLTFVYGKNWMTPNKYSGNKDDECNYIE